MKLILAYTQNVKALLALRPFQHQSGWGSRVMVTGGTPVLRPLRHL